MGVSGERVLAAICRAVEVTGASISTDDVLERRKLEAALEVEFRRDGLLCSDCGDLDWEDEE
ncbi:MAG: hypothetical protein ACRED4_00680 [Brevundimonas sp.]